MENQFIRTQMLVGEQGIMRLKNSTVAVFGVGGVGGYTVEALARSGVGTIEIIDNDTVSLSNINRQIIATHDTVGMQKTDAAEQRIKSINPDCTVIKHNCFFLPELHKANGRAGHSVLCFHCVHLKYCLKGTVQNNSST